VLDAEFLAATRDSLLFVQKAIHQRVGVDKLEQAGELGVLRLMMKYDAQFFKFLAIPEMLAIIDAYLSPTAVLHTQNGFVLPSYPEGGSPRIFQNMFHQDFPRFLNAYVASLNVMFAISEYTVSSGATLVVPGTHLRKDRPSDDYLLSASIPIECSEGSMIVFDSTLYHASGFNTSGEDRFAINQQFTRSFFKQQIDYAHALDPTLIAGLPPRSQQLLGMYTRVPKSLEDYYQLEERRLYRAGQG
jgi:ectoine hydroxylase-related dioxygenase (phytanoyl-CoA dioxygenase family)